MEKNIWVLTDNRTDMLHAQRSINSATSMRANCILTFEALEKYALAGKSMPSLIVIDYEMSQKEDFRSLAFISKMQSLVGIPIFFMVADSREETVNDCYMKGALAVLPKPLTPVSVERIEHMAWQFDVARNTEKKLEKQAVDLMAAREIERLNKQLEARNELLYQVFGRYFSDEVMEQIFQDPTGVSIGGEKKDMTVLIADLRGFTAVSQAMDSDSVMDLLNCYFGKMVEIIGAYQGTVIEFLGDGILAVFGAPIALEKHTESAVAAAITMQNAMSEVNDYCRSKGYETVDMGIGIHCGEVFIGNIGSDKVMRYNVIGRVVNECSRIESYSVGSQVLVSAQAIENIKCDFKRNDAIEVKAKGIGTMLKVYEVMGLSGDYACEIRADDKQQVYAAERKVDVALHMVIDKLMTSKTVHTVLKEVSAKYAIVELVDKKTELLLYDDVQMEAFDEAGNVLFANVYAKITDASLDRIKLYFTHVNADFRQFLEQIKSENGDA